MAHTLKVKNLAKYFDDYTVFENVDYEFQSGKIYALIGASGSGKTTLLNSIGRLSSVSEGNIYLDNKNIEDIKIKDYYRRVIGYLFQNYALVDEETVLQNLNIVKKYDRSILRTKLQQYGLNSSYLNRKVFTLSGGEAQRVALTRLSLQDPMIILADEPTGALDDKNRELVLNSLRKMANEDKIVIIATHDDVVRDFADQRLDISDYK